MTDAQQPCLPHNVYGDCGTCRLLESIADVRAALEGRHLPPYKPGEPSSGAGRPA